MNTIRGHIVEICSESFGILSVPSWLHLTCQYAMPDPMQDHIIWKGSDFLKQPPTFHLPYAWLEVLTLSALGQLTLMKQEWSAQLDCEPLNPLKNANKKNFRHRVCVCGKYILTRFYPGSRGLHFFQIIWIYCLKSMSGKLTEKFYKISAFVQPQLEATVRALSTNRRRAGARFDQ